MQTIDESLMQLTAPGIRGLRPYEPGMPVEELERRYGIRDSIKLASNENPLGPGPAVADAVRRVLDGISRYPDGNGYRLKQLLAERHGLSPEHITLGNGSNDVLELVARTFVTPADEVVFSEHAFAVYPIVTQAVGARSVVVPARPADAAAMPHGHDLKAMLAAVGELTRLVFIANPNNPTGTWLDAQTLESFISSLPGYVLVVVDEAYFEYARSMLPGASNYPDALQWVRRHPNLIVTRTFSKAYGLAGLRVGYAVARPAVTELLNRVRQPFNVNSLALAAAEAALEDNTHLEHCLQITHEGLQQLCDAFTAMRLAWLPTAGNFVCVNVGGSAREVHEALLRQGVIVRPVENYGLPDHLRITVGLPAENRRLVDALEQALERRERV